MSTNLTNEIAVIDAQKNQTQAAFMNNQWNDGLKLRLPIERNVENFAYSMHITSMKNNHPDQHSKAI